LRTNSTTQSEASETEKLDPNAKAKSFSYTKLILNLGISAAILYALWKFADIDVSKLITEIKSTDMFWFGLCCLGFLVQIFTSAYKWRKLTALLDYKLGYWQAVHMYFQATFSNSFLPSNFGGDALRAYKLAKDGDRNWIKAASTVLVERLFGFMVMFSMIPIGLILLKQSGLESNFEPKLIYLLWLGFAGMVAGIASYKLWSRIPFGPIQKINYAVEVYTKCHKSITSVIVWTYFTHGILLLSNIAAAKSVGVALHQIPIWYWFLLLPACTLASFVIPSVRGLGAKEACYVYFLAFLGVSSEQSLAVAFLCFAAFLITSLPGITLVLRRIFHHH